MSGRGQKLMKQEVPAMITEALTVTLGCAAGTVLLASLFAGVYLAGLMALLPGHRSASRGCPRCRRGTLERVAALPGGQRFYLCDSCRGRYKRSSRSGPWHDASAPEDDGAFQPRVYARACIKPQLPIDEETYWTGTMDTLLWGKRKRNSIGFNDKGSGDRAEVGHAALMWDRQLD
jgi:hypothetical protein